MTALLIIGLIAAGILVGVGLAVLYFMYQWYKAWDRM